MIIDSGFIDTWTRKGHRFGECMSHPESDLMYINIPKNASSWTKPNLQDWGWEFYNYHTDKLTSKTAIVVLRDPVDRWISGIAECLALYHPSFDLQDMETIELIFDRVAFDDHTEQQVKFLHGIDTDRCIFLKCDENYRQNFSNLIAEHYGPNTYYKYNYQHVSENSPKRKNFKNIFNKEIENPKYLKQIQDYYARDYDLINSITFYGSR